MKCIIIEDEYPAQRVLENYISKTNYLECLGIYETPINVPLEVFDVCDLIFLDIQMPEITGLDFLKAYKFKAKVIITTAYRDYAIDAFEENVADYFLKPFSYARFLKGVARVNYYFTNNNEISELFVYADKTFHKLLFDDILLLEAQIDYVKIYTSKEKILIQDSLNRWEEVYKKFSLVRVHRSYIVNINKIEKIQGNQLLINGIFIPIGKTYKEALFLKIKI